MKVAKLFLCINLFIVGITFSGCRRSSEDILEDSRSCGRYMGRGFRTLGGKHGDSRQVCDSDEFYGSSNGYAVSENEFIPLEDFNNGQQFGMNEGNYPQAKESPGDPGSSVPGIESFQDPSTNPELAHAFQNIYFEYNSSLIKGQQNLNSVRSAAEYLKSHPGTYVFVEGHTDERGSEAYNLALGSHRSNTVRNELIDQGASPDHIFTISYGKEHPLVMEHHEEAWSMNRRGEFKVYQR